jgi:CCR4-NOT transcription complex subunit 10
MITPDIVASMEDHDSSIPTLNTAVMMYHLQQYDDEMSVLEPLYSNVEPIDEIAALQVCLLMLDITLASHQPGKAAVSCRFLYLSL